MNGEYSPAYKGKNIPAEEIYHLTQGNSGESRYIFRIYYYWDKDDNKVVITWMESHLRTPAT